MPTIALTASGAVVDGREIVLTPIEGALLAWLLSHRGAPQPREVLLARVWGYRPGVSSRTVDMAVRRLREKLEVDPEHPSLLRTVRGLGYLLAEEGVRPALVGRVGERARLEAWLAGSGPLLVVTGPPGVGKSWLVEGVLAGRAPRWDWSAATVDGALRQLAAARGLVWLDDADPVLERVASQLCGARRLIATCRYPVDVPGAEHLFLAPLDAEEVELLSEQILAERFPHLGSRLAERREAAAVAGGIPALLRLALWEGLGGDLAAIPERHRGAEALYGWAIGDEDRVALCALAAGPDRLDAESAGILIGPEEARRRLVRLRDRWLVRDLGPDGIEVVPSVREGAQRLPEVEVRVEQLRVRAVERARALVEGLDVPPWGLLVWAAERSRAPDDLAWLALALDDLSARLGNVHDARPWLERALALAQPGGVRRTLLGRRVFAAYRAQESVPELSRALDEEVERAGAEDASSLVLAFRHLYARLWTGRIAESREAARRLAASSHRIRAPYPESLALTAFGTALGAEGLHEEALRAQAAALAASGLAWRGGWIWEVQLIHAVALADAGRLGEAVQRLAAMEGARVPSSARGSLVRGLLGWVSLDDDPSALAVIREEHRALQEVCDPRVASLAVPRVAAELALGEPEEALVQAAALAAGVREANALLAVWVRPLLAAARGRAGLPVGEVDLPAAVPGSDPVLERLTGVLLARAAGEPADFGGEPAGGLVARRLWRVCLRGIRPVLGT